MRTDFDFASYRFSAEGFDRLFAFPEIGMRGKARRAEGGAEQAYGEWLDVARDFARERPLLTVLGASALAFTVGALVAGGRDKN